MQLLGKITAPVLKARLPFVPEMALRWLARHSVDWYLMSEDLSHPDNRVAIDGSDIVLHWKRTNMTAHRRLVAKAREVFRAAGYPFVLPMRSTAARRRISAAPCAWAPIRRPQRSMCFAARTITPTSSWWMRPSCRPQRR
jgi:hypothetical protein